MKAIAYPNPKIESLRAQGHKVLKTNNGYVCLNVRQQSQPTGSKKIIVNGEEKTVDTHKGGQYYCLATIIQQYTDGNNSSAGLKCPECDIAKEHHNNNPLVSNTVLTEEDNKEFEKTYNTTSKPEETPKPVPEPTKTNNNSVSINISVEELETNLSSVIPSLISKIIESLDSLPTTNVKEVKRIMKIQEALENLLK